MARAWNRVAVFLQARVVVVRYMLMWRSRMKSRYLFIICSRQVLVQRLLSSSTRQGKMAPQSSSLPQHLSATGAWPARLTAGHRWAAANYPVATCIVSASIASSSPALPASPAPPLADLDLLARLDLLAEHGSRPALPVFHPPLSSTGSVRVEDAQRHL